MEPPNKGPHWIGQLQPIETSPPKRSRFEAAVIGGGYAGLSAAIHLAECGVETILMERDTCGFGGSGRNAGHLTPVIGKDIPSLLMVYGKEKTRRLVDFAERSVKIAETLISDNDISCDYHATGNVMTAVTHGQARQLLKSTETAMKLGLAVDWLDEDAMRERGIPAAFLSGMIATTGGTLHPGKYLNGLKRIALHKGVVIAERVHVLDYSKDGTYRIRTSAGVFEVDRFVIATNGYRPVHRYISKKTLPLTVTLLETKPLSANDMADLDWRGREGIYTGHQILESYRLTAQNTIVAGSKIVTPRIGYRNLDMPGKCDADIISAAFYQRFPQLDHVAVAKYWSGTLSFSMDFLPVIKELDCGITTACGFAGHGIGAATYSGRIAADILMGKARKKHFLLTRRVYSLPPRFLLKPAVRLIIAILRWMDRLTDRKARHRA